MFTVIIQETPQNDHGPLFSSTGQHRADAAPETQPGPIEHARVSVATLDIPALMALLYKTPRKTRKDAGKARETRQ